MYIIFDKKLEVTDFGDLNNFGRSVILKLCRTLSSKLIIKVGTKFWHNFNITDFKVFKSPKSVRLETSNSLSNLMYNFPFLIFSVNKMGFQENKFNKSLIIICLKNIIIKYMITNFWKAHCNLTKSKFLLFSCNTAATKVIWLSGLIIRTIPFTIGPAPEQAWKLF